MSGTCWTTMLSPSPFHSAHHITTISPLVHQYEVNLSMRQTQWTQTLFAFMVGDRRSAPLVYLSDCRSQFASVNSHRLLQSANMKKHKKHPPTPIAATHKVGRLTSLNAFFMQCFVFFGHHHKNIEVEQKVPRLTGDHLIILFIM